MKSLLEVLEEYNVEVEPEGKIYRGYCPFHNDTGRPNFTVYPDTNSWFCFACSFGGDIIEFIAKIEAISRSQAKAKLTEQDLDLESLQERVSNLDASPTVTDSYNQYLNIALSNQVQRYLKLYPQHWQEIFKITAAADHATQQKDITYEEAQHFLSVLPSYFQEIKP